MVTNNFEQKFNPIHRHILPQLDISVMAEEFFRSKRIEGVGAGTIENYQRVIKSFIRYCAEFGITEIPQVNVNLIRGYMMKLEDEKHNPGGCHHYYRALKTFLNWCEVEEEIDEWKNPFSTRRLKAPKLDEKPLEPVQEEDMRKMLDSCENSLKGLRDRSLLMVFIDTGVRAAELCDMMITDVDWALRSIIIPRGKGGKPRPVFISKTTKKALLAYLKKREDDCPNLFATIAFRGRETESINYSALRDIMRDISKKADVETPKIHGFRRAFALGMLRNGCDIFTLQRLMGHADLQVLRRYLKQTTTDLKIAHDKSSPVDSLYKKKSYR